MALVAFSGLQETSGPEQAALAASQVDLDPAGPIAAQDALDVSSTSGYVFIRPMGPPACYGEWYPLFLAIKAGINARAG